MKIYFITKKDIIPLKGQVRKLLSEFKNETYIPLFENLKSKRLYFIKKLYKLLKKKRLNKSMAQKRAFSYLFLPFKNNEKILWHNSIYDLKRLFDLLIDKELIEPPKYFNDFMAERFLIKKKQGEFQNFTSNSYKSSSDKLGYNDPIKYSKWEKRVDKLSSLFG